EGWKRVRHGIRSISLASWVPRRPSIDRSASGPTIPCMRWLITAVLLTACVGAHRLYVVDRPPPQPQYEVIQTRPGYVWVKGEWAWEDGQWRWLPGHYDSEREGMVWRDGYWEPTGDRWHWVEGHWENSHDHRVLVQ